MHYVGFGGAHDDPRRPLLHRLRQADADARARAAHDRAAARPARLPRRGGQGRRCCSGTTGRTIGDKTAVRWSIGAFTILLPEENEFYPVDARRRAASPTARASRTSTSPRASPASRDIGDNGTLQLGASARVICRASRSTFEPSGTEDAQPVEHRLRRRRDLRLDRRHGPEALDVRRASTCSTRATRRWLDDAGTPGTRSTTGDRDVDEPGRLLRLRATTPGTATTAPGCSSAQAELPEAGTAERRPRSRPTSRTCSRSSSACASA